MPHVGVFNPVHVSESELERLTRLCRHFGARPPQDRLMARKLLDRSEQMARTRGIDKVAALQYLLSLMMKAREATAPPDAAPLKGSKSMCDSKKINTERENN